MFKIGATYVIIQGIDDSLVYIMVTVFTWKYNKDNSNKKMYLCSKKRPPKDDVPYLVVTGLVTKAATPPLKSETYTTLKGIHPI